MCKIAVVDKSEVLCEVFAPEFDMAKAEQFVEQFSIEKAIVASTRGGAERICEQLRSKIAKVLQFTSQTDVPIEIEYSSRQTLGADRIAVAVGVVCEMGMENALIVAQEKGLQPREIRKEIYRKHIFTHIRWDLKGIYLEVHEPSGDFQWFTEEEINAQAALPTAFRQFWEEI